MVDPASSTSASVRASCARGLLSKALPVKLDEGRTAAARDAADGSEASRHLALAGAELLTLE
jgi:hypothetical protein